MRLTDPLPHEVVDAAAHRIADLAKLIRKDEGHVDATNGRDDHPLPMPADDAEHRRAASEH